MINRKRDNLIYFIIFPHQVRLSTNIFQLPTHFKESPKDKELQCIKQDGIIQLPCLKKIILLADQEIYLDKWDQQYLKILSFSRIS